MKKTVVKIEGMMCGMCEAHVNDVIRKNFKVKKVKSSHVKNEAVIISEGYIDENTLKSALLETGYKVLGVEESDYEKKGLFSFLKK